MSSSNSPQTPEILARVVVLISGSGTNLQAIIDHVKNGELPVEICAVISNKDNVKGIDRAIENNISAIVLDHNQFPSREAFDQRLMMIIDSHAPDIIVLAGFMRILTPEFTDHYLGKLLNIHPSLLPKYQGLHTHRRALEANDTIHGVTVHFVTAELDGGPAIVQAQVPVLEKDTEDTLAKRVQVEEHHIYPLAIKWLAQKRLEMRDGEAWLDGTRLPRSGFEINRHQL